MALSENRSLRADRAKLHPHFAYLPERVHDFLDVGCNQGELLALALEIGVANAFGIDINEHAIRAGRERLKDRRAELFHASADALPFPDASMDVVHCSEVLEHVPSDLRAAVVSEIRRVLRPDGRLILSVPHRGAFAWLDPSNVRFMWPKLYAMADRAFPGTGREVGYAGQKHGLVWHHHFSMPELRTLLEGQLRIEGAHFRGALLTPVCEALAFPFYRRKAYQHRVLLALKRLSWWERSLDFGERLAYDVLVVATPERP